MDKPHISSPIQDRYPSAQHRRGTSNLSRGETKAGGTVFDAPSTQDYLRPSTNTKSVILAYSLCMYDHVTNSRRMPLYSN